LAAALTKWSDYKIRPHYALQRKPKAALLILGRD